MKINRISQAEAYHWQMLMNCSAKFFRSFDYITQSISRIEIVLKSVITYIYPKAFLNDKILTYICNTQFTSKYILLIIYVINCYIPKLGFKTHSDPTPLKMRNKLSKVAKMVNSSLNAFLIFFWSRTMHATRLLVKPKTATNREMTPISHHWRSEKAWNITKGIGYSFLWDNDLGSLSLQSIRVV